MFTTACVAKSLCVIQKNGNRSLEDLVRVIQSCTFSNFWLIFLLTGRWIDFKNDYKTLDTKFMESVWWVFKQIYEKGLVYRGFKVMPYSTACATPLSNFEANQAYKDVDDPAGLFFNDEGKKNFHHS